MFAASANQAGELAPPEASALPDNMSLERSSTVAKDNSN
jgi:hypothetical protein